MELQRIRSILSCIDKKANIAILGSTVEYRDLLKEIGFDTIYVFDKNRAFYELSKTWCAYPTYEEIFVEGDWIETLHKYNSAFAVILSDLTMGNIEYSLRSDFYSSIYKAIKTGGFFIDKVLTNDLPFVPLASIKNKYLQLPLNILTANHFSCEALFCSELLNNEEIDTTAFYNTLRCEFNQSTKLMKLIELSHLITPENCLWHYGKSWHILEDSYISFYDESPFFLESSGSPYYGRLKHYFHKKG